MWFNADFMITIVPIFVGIAAVALLVFIIIKCVIGMRKFKNTIDAPVEVCEATVLQKNTVEKTHRVLSGADMTSLDTETITKWQIVFQLKDGVQKLLFVPEEIFFLMGEGDSGKLTFQKEQFIKFERF